jgi:hypothetical protein
VNGGRASLAGEVESIHGIDMKAVWIRMQGTGEDKDEEELISIVHFRSDGLENQQVYE